MQDGLKRGDILLYKPLKGDWLGNGIAFFSKGHYSHAAVYVGNDRIIESHLITGVVEKPLNPKWYPSIYVYRYKEPLSKAKTDRLMNWFRSQIGKGYDLPSFGETWFGILFSWTGIRKHKPKTNNPDIYYCSELVATGYNAIGINVTPKVHYMNCTPSDLGHSEELINKGQISG
jgi:uncharacterized protein YycO